MWRVSMRCEFERKAMINWLSEVNDLLLSLREEMISRVFGTGMVTSLFKVSSWKCIPGYITLAKI